MFAERFDTLMNIAEVSNSMLAKSVHMNDSHISRLRTGARALPKKHDYLNPMCFYLAKHFKKEYQIEALQKLTGIASTTLKSPKNTALYLEHWLLEEKSDSDGRLTSNFSHISSEPTAFSEYLYGNVGKRKAVEQFFLMILEEEKPQTILLFSDENMAWLYEDNLFAARWAELFTKVIMKGNRVKIIHTISRDMNEIVEAVAKWLPIYITGMIEPYFYPRLRDGVFQRTLFIAPNTAAIISTSVQQNTEGMLNFFLTDKSALDAVVLEYERYFSLCRSLMHIFTPRNLKDFHRTMAGISGAQGDVFLCCPTPPLCTMPESLVKELAEQTQNEDLVALWEQEFSSFQEDIKKQKLHIILLNPEIATQNPLALRPPLEKVFLFEEISYSKEQYRTHFEHLKKLEEQYENLTVELRDNLKFNMLLYVKEDVGVVMAKTDEPTSAFVINERNMINAFWDYLKRHELS